MGEGNKIGILFVLFITIIIGAVLVSSIADSVWDNVNAYTVANDTIDISGDRTTATGNMTHDSEHDMAANWIISISTSVLRNVSTAEDVTLTENTDFVVDYEDGQVTFYDTAAFLNYGGNQTEFVYTHGDEYVKSAVGRVLLDNFLVLFFIIGLVVWAVYTVKKEFLDDLGM